MTAQKIGAIVFFVLLAEILNNMSQFLFKKTANSIQAPQLSHLKSYGPFFHKVLRSVWIWLGLGVMAVGLVVWLAALSEGELSFVYSIGSLQYILVLLTARFLLKEKVNRTRVIGTILVASGIFLITLS